MSSSASEIETIKILHKEFIEELFGAELGIAVKKIDTLSRYNNNFIHFVTFSSPLASDVTISSKPATNAVPSGTSEVIFRITNPASMFNHAVKVENTVAMMQLMRQALSKLAVVPHVYAWSAIGGPSGSGWIIEQHMPGINIESDFHNNLSTESQRHVLGQIAEVLKMVQDFRLPAAASGFGGLAFNEYGNTISGPFVVEPYTGPYPDMRTFYKDMLRAQLEATDRSRVAMGWRKNGLRDRLDTFAEMGLESVLSRLVPDDVEPRLIIGDVVIANFLFHPTTHEVLGLVDYDCSHTGHPLHEFFFSSFSLSYCAVSADSSVASALFHGFPSPLPVSASPASSEYRDNDAPQWAVMAMFEEEMKRVEAARPRNIKGAEEIAKVYEFISELCPFFFLMERWIKRQSEEKLQICIKEQEEKIGEALANWGF